VEDVHPSVMGVSNPSTDSRTKVKCSAHSSVHSGIKFTKSVLQNKILERGLN